MSAKVVLVILVASLVAGSSANAGGDGDLSDREVVAFMESAAVRKYAEISVHFVRPTVIQGGEAEMPPEMVMVIDAGAGSVPQLISLLEHTERSVRIGALIALEKITLNRTTDTRIFWDSGAGSSLERAAGVKRWKEWWRTHSGRSRTDWLLEALRADRAGTRGLAAQALAEVGDSRAVEPLRLALSDEVPYVREEAALALGVLGDYCSVPEMISFLLQSGHAGLASRGIEVLRKLAVESGSFERPDSDGSPEAQIEVLVDWWEEAGAEVAKQNKCSAQP